MGAKVAHKIPMQLAVPIILFTILVSGFTQFTSRRCNFSQTICMGVVDLLGSGSWDDAYALANATVAKMTLSEKIGIVRGTGQLNSNRTFSEVLLYNYIPDYCAGRCVGDTTAVTRLGVPSICFNDGPAGMRLTKNVTGFPAGINAASTFSRRLMRARGKAMAEEFRGKGAQ